MSEELPTASEFDQGAPDVLAPGEGELILDLEGYEGPLDVLLTLARDQKVDLRRISMVALVDQYLVFVQQARRLRLELAADYLVMAAWLAYLKSRLMLPEPPQDEEPTGEQMADALQWQLRRLEAMQQAGTRLMAHPRLGVDTFGRGRPEGALVLRRTKWDVQLYELLKAYGDQQRPKDADAYHIRAMQFFSVEEALERLERMLGIALDWASLATFLPPGLTDPLRRRSAVAATFVATLQLAKDGVIQLRQTESFGPLMVRRRAGEEAPSDMTDQPDMPETEAAAPDIVADPHAQNLRLVEALLFASAQPLDASTLAERLPDDADIDALLAELAEMYAGRGVNLVRIAGGFVFRTAPDLAQKLRIETQVTRKLSRAAVETLAIIAYHQPVTRAEIEQIRGVGLSKGTLDFLFEQNWIRPMGRRRAPGKPVTWGTTDFFLEHFGLSALEDLPGMDELKAAGLLDPRAQPSIYRPEEPDLPLTDEGDDGPAEPLEAGDDAPVKAAD